MANFGRVLNPFDDGTNPYVPITSAATGIPQSDVRFIRVGALGLAYVFQHFLNMLYIVGMTAYVLGILWSPFDPNEAWTTWDPWWMLAMPVFTLWWPSLACYFLYQERKINWTAAIGTSQISVGLGQSIVRIIYVIYLIGTGIAGGACGVTFVFFLIARSDCSGSDLCAGVDFSKTASSSFIMLLGGSGLMMVVAAISFVISFFINSASRDVYVQSANAATTGINYSNVEGEITPNATSMPHQQEVDV